MTSTFNPFVRIKEKTVTVKVVPESLKPFAPKLKTETLHAGGYIKDVDFFDGTLFLVYSTGTRVLYRGIDKNAVDGILTMEVNRFYAGF